VAKWPASYPARNEQVKNVHVDSSQGGGIKFVLCDIDPHHVCLSTECTEEVINEAPKEAEKAMLGLVNLSFPDAVQLLEVPCIWIGDTAATVHITPHEEGMVPNKDDKMKGLAITVGNWAQEIPQCMAP